MEYWFRNKDLEMYRKSILAEEKYCSHILVDEDLTDGKHINVYFYGGILKVAVWNKGSFRKADEVHEFTTDDDVLYFLNHHYVGNFEWEKKLHREVMKKLNQEIEKAKSEALAASERISQLANLQLSY